LSAGAFSDPGVVAAAERIVCVFVDCDWGKKNKELTDAYGVRGYPTVVFCDPDAKPIGGLTDVDAESVIRKMTEVADKYGAQAVKDVPVPQLTGMSYGAALREARRLPRPIAFYFYDDTPPSAAVTLALTDPAVKKVLGRYYLALTAYKKDSEESEKFGVQRSPTILILDGTRPKPEEKPLATITGSKSPRELVRELEAALAAGSADPGTASPAPGGRPAPRAPEEKLSDDELERKFIQARVGIALETLKKGRKDKAIEILEDVVKSYPKHVETPAVKKMLEDLKK
jgi:hypothetical protein